MTCRSGDGLKRRAPPDVAPSEDIIAFAASIPFDVLLSITNRMVLPPALAQLPRWTPNYHYGPLPRYAGLNAQAWAIIHRERSHGIAWHRIGERIDGGAIVKART